VLAVLVERQSDPDLAMAPGRVQVEAQSLGLILALRLSRIRGVFDDTKVSGRTDKTRECQPQILVETHYDYPDTHRDSGEGSAGKTSMR